MLLNHASYILKIRASGAIDARIKCNICSAYGLERKTQHAVREGMMQTGIEATKHAVIERIMIHIVIGREVQCSAVQRSAAQCIPIVGSRQFCHLTRAIAPTSASFGTVSHPLYTNFHSFSDRRSRIEMQFKNLSTDILLYIRGSWKIRFP